MVLERPPAGKEAAVVAGKTGGMYHRAKGRPRTGSSTTSRAGGLGWGLLGCTLRKLSGANGSYLLNAGLFKG